MINQSKQQAVAKIERIYKHPYITDFRITAEITKNLKGKTIWRVTILLKSSGTFRDLPLSVDIDIYVFAILHAVDFFEYKRSIKWNEKEILNFRNDLDLLKKDNEKLKEKDVEQQLWRAWMEGRQSLLIFIIPIIVGLTGLIVALVTSAVAGK